MAEEGGSSEASDIPGYWPAGWNRIDLDGVIGTTMLRSVRPVSLSLATAAVLMACGTGQAAVPPSASAVGAVPITSATSSTPVASSVVASVPAEVPLTCAITKPTLSFVPPPEYAAPARPPDAYDAEWFGDAHLWTMVRRGGEVWFDLPRGPDGLVQKTFWWSTNFDASRESQPAISVTGRQLDGSGVFSAPAPGTNAQADFGSSMLAGIDIPSTGCWEITATYKGATLAYVVWVGD